MLVNSSINASGAYSRLSLGYRRFGMGPILAIPQVAAAACLQNGHVTTVSGPFTFILMGAICMQSIQHGLARK